jgi:hypothetical protein
MRIFGKKAGAEAGGPPKSEGSPAGPQNLPLASPAAPWDTVRLSQTDRARLKLLLESDVLADEEDSRNAEVLRERGELAAQLAAIPGDTPEQLAAHQEHRRALEALESADRTYREAVAGVAGAMAAVMGASKARERRIWELEKRLGESADPRIAEARRWFDHEACAQYLPGILLPNPNERGPSLYEGGEAEAIAARRQWLVAAADRAHALRLQPLDGEQVLAALRAIYRKLPDLPHGASWHSGMAPEVAPAFLTGDAT